MNDLICVGKIVNTHGLKGQLKIYPYNDPEKFLEYKAFYLNNKLYKRHSGIIQKTVIILKLEGIDSIEQAETFRGHEIFIENSQLTPMMEDEYLISDMIGLEAVDTSGLFLGEVTDVLSYAANDVLAIKNESGTHFVPNIKEFVKKIDMDCRKITIAPIKGMFDDI